MIKKIRYIIIAVVFLACSMLIGFKTLYNNYRPLAVSILDPIRNDSSNQSLIKKLSDSSEALINNTNNIYNTSLSGKKYFIEAYGATQLILNKKLIEDASIGYMLKDNQNMLHFVGYTTNTRVEANMLKDINEYMKSIDMPFVFITSLSKDIENFTTFKSGIEVYANSNKNKKLFFDSLKDSDISLMDLNEFEDLKSMDKTKLFFKTDHHWRTETAFWAYTKILDYINKHYFDNEIDTSITTDINSFKKIELKNAFLGSLGKRMGTIYSGIDDYTYLVPDFETNYLISTDFNKKTAATGSFEDVIIDKVLSDPDMPVDTNRYGTYFGMDKDFETIINNNCTNNFKICIIKDSYCLPVAAFLSLNFKEVTLVDLRLTGNNSVKEFIENGNYDLVIMNYGLGSIANENMFKLN